MNILNNSSFIYNQYNNFFSIIYILMLILLSMFEKKINNFLNKLFIFSTSISFIIINSFSLYQQYEYKNLLFYQNKISLISQLIISYFLFFIVILNYKIINIEKYLLILFSYLGSSILLISNNILLLYLSLEIIYIPIYILIFFNNTNIYSVESSLKYFILGNISTVFIFYGMSILYSYVNSVNIYNIILYIHNNHYLCHEIYFIISILFIFIGISIKIGIGPFFIWLSDIYEGASIVSLMYMSSIINFSMIFLFYKMLPIIKPIIGNNILFFITVSMIFANIFAYFQKRIKKILAYTSLSSIAYVLSGVFLYNYNDIIFSMFYISLYMFFLLNFLFFINQINKKSNVNFYKISHLKGLYANIRNKYPIVIFILYLLNLIAIPPFITGISKIFIIYELIKLKYINYTIVLLVGTLINIFCYINIIHNIFINNKKIIIRKTIENSKIFYTFHIMILFLNIVIIIFIKYIMQYLMKK